MYVQTKKSADTLSDLVRDPSNKVILTTVELQKLKQNARRLKRDSELTHTQALDKVCRDLGFLNWNHAVSSNAHAVPIERAFQTGCILIFDPKDGDELADDLVFIRDDFISTMYRNEIIKAIEISFEKYRDPEDIEPFYWTDEDEFELDCNVCFRIDEQHLPNQRGDLLALIEDFSFFPPEIVFWKGKPIDLY